MLGPVGNLFKVEEIRKKIAITLGLLFISRIGAHIPLPGVDVTAWYEFVKRQGDTGVSQLVGLMNALSGGNLNSPVLFSLGILPYITSSIIFSLLVKVVPSLEALSKEGAAGQKKINQLSRLMTVPLCVFQGAAICFTFFRQMGDSRGAGMVVPEFGLGFVVMAVIGMTAGTIFLMWLGEQITEYGIGNGVSLLIVAGIVVDVPIAFYTMLKRAADDPTYILITAVLTALYVGIVVGVVYMTKGQRRIPIQQAKQMKGRRMMGGARHYLPIKLNMANVMPVIFASSLLILPSTVIGWATGTQDGWPAPGGWWWITLEIALIFFFSFFWTSLMFQPTEMANNLKEYGSFIPGIRPGKKTADFLERVMVRITLVGGAFLATISVIPTFVVNLMDVDFIVARFLGGTGILIVVGVSLDLVDKLNASLLQRNYEGFMSAAASKRGSGGR